MGNEIKIWYDQEGDYLEVLFDSAAGFFKETDDDAVMEKVDTNGNLIGFSILRISAFRDHKSISLKLKNRVA